MDDLAEWLTTYYTALRDDLPTMKTSVRACICLQPTAKVNLCSVRTFGNGHPRRTEVSVSAALRVGRVPPRFYWRCFGHGMMIVRPSAQIGRRSRGSECTRSGSCILTAG